MSKRILFVSRRNSLRSVLARACLMHMGSHLFGAECCGQPGQLSSATDAAAIDDGPRASHAALQILFALQRRLELLVNLPLHHADASALRSDLQDLGRMA